MLFLIAITLACVFAWFCAKPLRAHPTPFYAGAAVVTIVMILIGQAHLQNIPAFVNTYVIGLFNRGALAAALWCVVAGMGALPNGTAPIKRLMPARGELSIFAAVVTLSHAVTYSITYIRGLLNYSKMGRSPGTEFILTCIVCLLLMLIMIPLTVISFKSVRKKMNAKKWKLVQRAAYVFYALIYLHVMVIFIPRARSGVDGAMLSVLVYSIVFLGYAAFRIRKWILVKKKPEDLAILNTFCTAALVLAVGCVGISARAGEKQVETAEVKTAPVSVSETSGFSQQSAEADLTEISTESISETIEQPTETMEVQETAAETAIAETDTSETAPTETTSVTEPAATDAPAEVQQEEIPAEEQPAEEEPEQPVEEQPVEEQPEQPAEEQPVEEQPAPEPEPVYIYNNGTFTGDGLGYMDSPIHVTITIQDDRIVDLSATSEEGAIWGEFQWFDESYPLVRDAIIANNSPYVDIVSAATFSPQGIMQGAATALESARK